MQVLTILLENIIVPCLINPSLFTIAFKSFCTYFLSVSSCIVLFLRCIKACDNLSDDVISHISACLNRMNIPVDLCVDDDDE